MITLATKLACMVFMLPAMRATFPVQSDADTLIRSSKISGTEFESIEVVYRAISSKPISSHQKDLSNYEITVWEKGPDDYVMFWPRLDDDEPIIPDSILARNGVQLLFIISRKDHKVEVSLPADLWLVPDGK
jgi:hypothetical protein